MDQATHNKIVSFIWGIADHVLRDLFRRGKYPDVILPMCVVRRMDAVLEPTKAKVLEAKVMQLLVREDTELYKQFVENSAFKRSVGDMVYRITNPNP